MINYKFTITGAGPMLADSWSLVKKRVMDRMREEIGGLIIESIQEVLGDETQLLFQLDPEYALRKQRDPRLQRVAGKSGDQPLILTRKHIFDALEVYAEVDGLVVTFKPGENITEDGFDVFSYWETVLEFMEKGMELSRPKIQPIFSRIIREEIFA